MLGRALRIPAPRRHRIRQLRRAVRTAAGPADYLAIASRFDVLLLARIPGMNPTKRNEAKRFVTLIDALYEHKVKLICSAERSPGELYPEGISAPSNSAHGQPLHEMQSEGPTSAASTCREE